jgi:hypothetical protein
VTAGRSRVSPGWLALREDADAAARSTDLADCVARHLAADGGHVIHDLGGGTGAMARWLAPRLRGTQHWVVHDVDSDLLRVALANPPVSSADGAAVTVEVEASDVTRLESADLAGAALITASALLDLLAEDELPRLLEVCVGVGCPMLLSLSVVGRVALDPPYPLDSRVAAAFNAHQRRAVQRGRLLGPAAPDLAVAECDRMGVEVIAAPSPWQLGPEQGDLIEEWFAGWLGAACEQEAELAAQTADYAQSRLAQARAGRLAVNVGHVDLLIAG